MTSPPLTAPDAEHLADLGLEVEVGDEPWVRSVTLGGEDHPTVTVTWDEVAASAHVVWTDGGTVVAELSRETVDTVGVSAREDGYQVTITSRSEGIAGVLAVTVAPAGVRLHDRVLRA